VAVIHQFLIAMGLPEEDCPKPITVVRMIIVIIITLLSYYFILGKRHMKNRVTLNKELKVAQARVRSLQEKLKELDRVQQEAEKHQRTGQPKKEIRIFMDGAFDLLHYGHMNAFRLARSLGTRLVVGVNSDESITQCKGAPLMSDEERLLMVKTCKFVDKVVENCPYVMSPEYLDWVIKEYDIDYVVHGSDPCYTLDGQDVYVSAKAAGKFRTIPRTEGVSTSDILGRILTMNKEHHIHDNSKEEADDDHHQHHLDEGEQGGVLGHKSKFLTTSLLLKLFSAGVKAPEKDARIVYIDGTWDLFHPGHVDILKAAREVSS
jgi:ethanolamine-phosphate cytidylyltransferase